MRQVSKLYPYIFAIFCGSLPFGNVIKVLPNLLLIVLGVAFLFIVKKKDIKHLQTKSFYALFSFVLLAIFLIVIKGRWEDSGYIPKLLSILALPILAIPIKRYMLVLKIFVLSTFALLLFSVFKIVHYVIEFQEFKFATGSMINELLLGERPYIGFMYILAAAISFYLARTSQKFVWYLLSLCFIVMVISISARMAIISVLLMAFASIFYLFRNLKMAVLILVSILFLAVGLFKLNDNLKQRFLLTTPASKTYVLKEKLILEPRFHIWQCAANLTHSVPSFFLGKGFKQTERELTNCYQQRTTFYTEDQKQWFVNSRFNTHNQYLDIYLNSGIIALILFVGFLVFAFVENRNSYFATAILVFLILFLTTENLIYRQLGTMLIGLIVVFLSFLSAKTGPGRNNLSQ